MAHLDGFIPSPLCKFITIPGTFSVHMKSTPWMSQWLWLIDMQTSLNWPHFLFPYTHWFDASLKSPKILCPDKWCHSWCHWGRSGEQATEFEWKDRDAIYVWPGLTSRILTHSESPLNHLLSVLVWHISQYPLAEVTSTRSSPSRAVNFYC